MYTGCVHSYVRLNHTLSFTLWTDLSWRKKIWACLVGGENGKRRKRRVEEGVNSPNVYVLFRTVQYKYTYNTCNP